MKNSRRLVNVLSICFKRCWIIGVIVAISALVWFADEPAWAGPQQQFTVPTATPQPFEPEEELVPTATPVSIFEPDDNDDSNSNNNGEPIVEEEPTQEPFFPEEPVVEEPAQPEEDLFNDPSTDESDGNIENAPTEPIDSGTTEDTLFNPSADLLDDATDTVDFSDPDTTDDFSTGGGATGGSSTGGSAGSAAGGSVSVNSPDAASASGNNLSGNSGVVSISVLNIRRDPSPDADIIDTMWRNDVVEISQTANDGTWLLVCCGVERGSAGWVSSLFINYDDSSLSVGSLDGAASAEASDEVNSAVPTAATGLEVTMFVTDTTVQAGQILDIEYSVENFGTVDALNVLLSNELPVDLFLNNFKMDATGQFTHTINAQNGRRIFNVTWPEVAALQTVTATVTVQIAPGAPNGLVIDNLAGVAAENAEGDTAAISIGTPPLAPPSFRRR